MPEVEYGLPFDIRANEIKISQGRNGPWSHFSLESGGDRSNAIDFALPLGTEVKAMRSGRVLGFVDNSEVCYQGGDRQTGLNLPSGATNFVAIQHIDGSIAFYMHLAKKGVYVKLYDVVQKGQLLGETGLSGWVGYTPHLHVQINQRGISLPIKFEGYDGSLEHNEIYSPTVNAERSLVLPR